MIAAQDSTSIWYVVTADQRHGKRDADAVSASLQVLRELPSFDLAFERSVEDELQGLTASPSAVVAAVRELSRFRDWHIGIGVGRVHLPLPSSARQAQGTAVVAARTAMIRAKNNPTKLALEAATDSVGPAARSDLAAAGRRTEAGLWLLRSIWMRRTPEGWGVADLLSTGMTNHDAALALHISPSAASQRAWAAGVHVTVAGETLVTWLIEELSGSLTDVTA